VHDTIEFEKRGIPATTIITAAFKNAAVFQFRAKGMDGHAYIELPHPISNLKPEEMQDVTLRYIDQMVRQLTA
jgi:hypothetical protein